MSEEKGRFIKFSDYTAFEVTGVDRDEKRFSMRYAADRFGAMTAFGINLWRGNVWGVRKDTGKRERLKSVYN
jgi:hypothetical protein